MSATLNGGFGGPPSTAFVYLMNQFGLGTTAGANQMATQLVSIPSGTSGATLFTGLTLGPGAYYLLANEIDACWTGIVTPDYSVDSGIENTSSSTNDGAIAAYAPDKSYKLISGAVFFSVIGHSQCLGGCSATCHIQLASAIRSSCVLRAAVKRLQTNNTSDVTKGETCHGSNMQ